MTIQQHASFDAEAAGLNATSNTNPAVSKMVKLWESKNAQRALKGSGLTLMAMSLTACGGEDITQAQLDAQAALAEAAAAAQAAAEAEAAAAAAAQAAAEAEAADAAAAQAAAEEAAAAAEEAAAAAEAARATAEAAEAAAQAELDALLTPASGEFTTGVNALAGSAANDSFTAADGTIAAGDALVDSSTTDNDTLTITDVGATLASMGTISNIETITLNASSTAAYTITSAANVTNSAVTVNMTLPGGGTAVTVSDIGTGSSVVAGDRVADLTVDYLGTRGDVSVTGGTGALSVNGSDATIEGLIVDGSAGTTTAVDFGDDSSDISVTSGTGSVTIGSTAAAGDFAVSGLTVDASATTGTAAIDVDYGTGSSNVTVTAGDATGTIAVGAAGEAVTGLTLDASNADGGAISVLTATGSSGVNVTLGADSGALTATGAGVAGDISVTSLQAIGALVTEYEDVTIAANSTTATTAAGAAYTSDANVTDFAGSAASAAQYMDLGLSTALESVTLSGGQVITVSVDADIFDTVATNTLPSITSTGAAHIIALADVATVGLDLSGVTNTIELEAAQTTAFELANNADITLSAAQAAAVFNGVAASQTLTIDMDGNNFTGTVQNVATLNVTSDDAATLNVSVDANDAGAVEGATIVLSGEGNVTVSSTTVADSLNASASTGDLNVTTSATIDTVTTGAGDDTVIAYAGDHTVVMGAGDDTYSIGVDISADTVSVSGHEIVTLTAASTMTVAQANAILNNKTVDGTFVLNVNGTATADTFNISGAVEGANPLTSVTIDAGVGDDTIVLNDEFTSVISYTSGADGADTITGFTTGTDQFDTDFVTTAGGAGFATVSATITADTTAALNLTAAGATGGTAVDDGILITVDSLASTSEADVISAISNGEINITGASNSFQLLLNDGTASYLFEVTASANNATLTATDDAIVHVATFTDEVLVAADIV